MKQTWAIALAQIPCREGDKEANLQEIEQAIEEAHTQGADILVLPEIILTGFVHREALRMLAETRDGESMARIRRKLADFPLYLVYSFPELGSDGEVYNTTCFLQKDGTPLAYYRKTHLFAGEKKITKPGEELICLEVEGVKFGILVCFDLEFPEAARALAMQGMHVLLVPSANMSPYEYPHRIFTVARALENHIFVAYCNRIGVHKSFVYRGQSILVDPSGKILLECADNKRDIQTVQIQLENIRDSREMYDYLEERRPELYR
ncbi:carbon-nitrogen hydrolase family protein [Aneurinibacillus migulanus]|uniref:carbon-nitrogen hydrolase family protein n=1 Tax=Aneurinibacillus migulanus TaxID=47500 RepID=UPI0005C2F114|nr:carbon-nitrogen hydrolase family protein [Aneurinibacillus migulanus]KIV56897.1 hypothetical protein TS64_09070 [Aneurinibacillus migulanus]CEH29067.1 Hydrolase, carbon-nitrogen family [Aneurinibacillus migulanus]